VKLRTKLTWIAVLYFAEGFPFGIAYDIWPVYYRAHGVDLREIGLMSLLFLPYTLKATWAPLIDRVGLRQIWIASMEFGLAAVCLVMLLLDPTNTNWVMWAVLLTFTFLSATQDVSIDAYAVDVSTPRDAGHINGQRVAAYRVALIFAGGVLLLLADRDWCGWRGMWVVAAGLCILLGVLALLSPRIKRVRAGKDEVLAETSGKVLLWRLCACACAATLTYVAFRSGWSGIWLLFAVVAVMFAVVSFLSPAMLKWAFQWHMLPVVGVVVLYKVGDSTLGRMVKPFWVDHGMTPTEIGVVSTTAGMWLTIMGAILGGWYIQRRGIFSALLWMGVSQAVSNFGYVAVAALNLPRGETMLWGLSFGPFQASIYLASIVESLTQGLGTAAFLSFLMNLCDKKHAAAQYALLSALFALTRDVAGAFSGIGVESLGYAVYFAVTAALALPALALLPLVRSRIREGSEVQPELSTS
jgi:PAT family beta-lactamase induction signal transducer AmpG